MLSYNYLLKFIAGKKTDIKDIMGFYLKHKQIFRARAATGPKRIYRARGGRNILSKGNSPAILYGRP